MKTWVVLSLLAAGIGLANAEQAQRFGDIEIHYNAMSTAELRPEVAKTYNIDRSSTKGLLTVSVLKKNAMDVANPIPARLSVNAVNLNAQLSNITMREIKEGAAVYYIGEFRVQPSETLKFEITAVPDGEKTKRVAKFQKTFYP